MLVISLSQNPPLPPKAKRSKSKKHLCEDDVLQDDKTDGVITDEYKALAAHLKCEACKGHCYVMRNGEHQHLDYKEISYWAKQTVWFSCPFFMIWT